MRGEKNPARILNEAPDRRRVRKQSEQSIRQEELLELLGVHVRHDFVGIVCKVGLWRARVMLYQGVLGINSYATLPAKLLKRLGIEKGDEFSCQVSLRGTRKLNRGIQVTRLWSKEISGLQERT